MRKLRGIIQICFSLQEINSQPQSVVKGLFKDDPWTQKFKELLKIRGYITIKSEQMQGLLVLLFAKKQHLLHVREVESEYTRTGLGGIWVRIFFFFEIFHPIKLNILGKQRCCKHKIFVVWLLSLHC